MNSNSKSPVSGDFTAKKANGKDVVSSGEPVKQAVQISVSLSSALSGDLKTKKPNGKAVGTVIQGFIPPRRIDTYLPHMIAGSIYRLNRFYGSKSKNVFRVADPDVTISFTWNSVLSPLENSPVQFPEDRFRFYGHEEFEAACDLRGVVYDFVGHIKLVNEQVLNDGIVLDEGDKASTRRVLVHVQTHDGPVMKLNLWDKAATDFYEKFKAHGNTPSVILVTTVNPKRFGGALNLSSLSSSRVFFDMDVQPTRDYLTWLNSNSEVANRVNPEIVTKAETSTIGDIFSCMKQEGAKLQPLNVSHIHCFSLSYVCNFTITNTQVAWFECTATIDDVVHGSAWYYISCGGCKTKATKGPTTLMCKKCGKAEVTGVAEYLTKLSVYDNNDQAHFVLLGDVGRELTGKTAAELVANYFEFVIKVSKHNLEGKTQALTVTKVLTPDAPVLEDNVEENVDDESADERKEVADESVKRSSDGVESGEVKHAKCG
ncbi:hypothetical protein Bca52824_046418 [Brassica carinata]|uniref:Replication factor A C-terminal domain-containing protein n=1 Tax=Brassica carinata TaxID=52824 RepID=A0A8X7UQ72_BRACI|nr:hypothetical protein Bca52824_046418 [Brassica carinata]